MQTSYDYVVVGAGSSGCVLAYRLAQQTSASVLLIEAGGADRNPLIKMPLGFASLIGEGSHNWGYRTAGEPRLGGRRVALPRGRVLGGCSSINGMVYIRGQREDYDGWAAHGNTGWDYASVLPLFKKSENHWNGTSRFHGAHGELDVKPVAAPLPIADRFIEAAQQQGLAARDDFNAGDQAGVGYFDVNISGGIRHNTARAFLRAGTLPPNLTVLTHAVVEQLLLRGGRAAGVRVRRKKQVTDISANKETVLCAGALHSPQILERSGVGDPSLLTRLGIEPVCARPAVGQHLKDHFNTLVVVETRDCKTYFDYVRPRRMASTLLHYLTTRRGICANPAAMVGAFLHVDSAATRPDAEIHFAAGASVKTPNGRLKPIDGICASICRLRPASSGSVHINSRDPEKEPVIQANYLSQGDDAAFQVRAVRRLREMFNQAALRPYIARELEPGCAVTDDAALLEFIRETGDSVHHPVGTCRMGADDEAVVDPSLRVRGLDGIRVADASIFPTVVSGNTHAPCVMVGEKAADLMIDDA